MRIDAIIKEIKEISDYSPYGKIGRTGTYDGYEVVMHDDFLGKDISLFVVIDNRSQCCEGTDYCFYHYGNFRNV